MITGAGTNTNKVYMTGFYYNDKYYGSLGVESSLEGNNYVNLSPKNSWTRVVINGTELPITDITLLAYYRE